jgi:hypothetical protein
MFQHARLQAKIFGMFVATELLLAIFAPYWHQYINPFGLF